MRRRAGLCPHALLSVFFGGCAWDGGGDGAGRDNFPQVFRNASRIAGNGGGNGPGHPQACSARTLPVH